MSGQETTVEHVLSGMSDDEFMNSAATLSGFSDSDADDITEEQEQSQEDEFDESGAEQDEFNPNDDSDDTDAEAADDTDSEDAGTDDNEQDNADSEEEDENSEEEQEEADESEESTELSAEDFMAAVTKPFTAGNREIQVNTPEEAIRLMQQGVGFSDRMKELKPHLRLLRTLDQHKLLSNDNVNFAIDLMSGDPSAVAKLVKDRGIDLDSLEDGGQGEYTPSNHLISEEQSNFTDVVEQMRTMPKYEDTLKQVQRFDTSSRDAIANDPKIMMALREHHENGIYDKITAEMQRLEVLYPEKLTGSSDLERYLLVGKQLQESGALSPQNNSNSAPATKQASKRVVKDKPTPSKRQAANKKTTPPKKKQEDNSVLDDMQNMSDEEFMKKYG